MTSYNWLGGALDNTGSWGQPDPENPVVPGDDDIANISGTGSVTGTLSVMKALLTASGGALDWSASLTSAQQISYSGGTMNLLSGSIISAGFSQVGGEIVQSGGALTVTTGPLFVAGDINAIYSQNGGSVTVTADLIVGSNDIGTYNLAGGMLIANAVRIGNTGTGTFTQTGGTQTVSGVMMLGFNLQPGFHPASFGNYELNGGSFSVETLSVGASYACTGTFLFNPDNGDDATLAIGEPGLIVGNEGTGTFVMGGGTLETSLAIALENDGLGNRSAGTFTLQGGKLISADENVGVEGDGFFIHEAGQNKVTGAGLIVGDIGSGTYQLQGGKLDAVQEIVGNRGFGTVTQTGGTNLVRGDLILGKAGEGTYDLSGAGKLDVRGDLTLGLEGFSIGWLNISGPDATVTVAAGSRLMLGIAGYGEVNQSGGQLTAKMVVGNDAFRFGAYNLSGGKVISTGETVGLLGNGTFSQSGGSNLMIASGAMLVLGSKAGSSGTYDLTGGTLKARSEIIGDSGEGLFTQDGGAHTVTAGNLIVGNRSGSDGAYQMHSGDLTLNQGDLVIGARGGSTGNFELNLEPGDDATVTLTLGDLVIGSLGNGSFSLGGGALAANLVLGAQSGGTGTFDLTGGALSTTGGNQVIGGEGTGTFAQDGGSNTIENGGLFIGNSGGTGSYILGGDGVLAIKGGRLDLGVSGSATGNFFYNTEAGDDAKLTIDTKVISVGFHGDGSFIMGGGKLNAKLVVGAQVGGNGVFELDAGKVFAAGQVVGNNGTGTFNMNGGTDQITQGGDLILGAFSLGNGTYNLSGGKLLSGGELIGYRGAGTFTQTGGNNRIFGDNSLLNIGVKEGAQGLYTLEKGKLTAIREVIGDEGTGDFVQSGGKNTLGGAGKLVIGAAETGVGTYDLSGGTLDARQEVVGDAGEGTFTQSGGTNTVEGRLTLGLQAGGDGTYDLSGGKLVTEGEVIGDKGDGAFHQSGGSNTITGNLVIGRGAGSNGLYEMTGGTLTLLEPVGLTAVLTVGASAAAEAVMTVTDAKVTTSALRIGGDMTAGSGSLINIGTLLDMRGGTLDAQLGKVIVGNGTGETGSIVIGAGGTLAGSGTLNADVREALQGSVLASGGVLTITGDVSGKGDLHIDKDGVLELLGGNRNDVAFLGDGGILRLHETDNFSGQLTDISLQDTIELVDIVVTHLKLKAGKLILTESDGSKTVLLVTGDLTGNHFALSDDGEGGSIITLAAGGFVSQGADLL